MAASDLSLETVPSSGLAPLVFFISSNCTPRLEDIDKSNTEDIWARWSQHEALCNVLYTPMPDTLSLQYYMTRTNLPVLNRMSHGALCLEVLQHALISQSNLQHKQQWSMWTNAAVIKKEDPHFFGKEPNSTWPLLCMHLGIETTGIGFFWSDKKRSCLLHRIEAMTDDLWQCNGIWPAMQRWNENCQAQVLWRGCPSWPSFPPLLDWETLNWHHAQGQHLSHTRPPPYSIILFWSPSHKGSTSYQYTLNIFLKHCRALSRGRTIPTFKKYFLQQANYFSSIEIKATVQKVSPCALIVVRLTASHDGLRSVDWPLEVCLTQPKQASCCVVESSNSFLKFDTEFQFLYISSFLACQSSQQISESTKPVQCWQTIHLRIDHIQKNTGETL